jgi:UDP-glucose:(heptosyl)LPS alpha-1,3-glucosyltransferase
MRNHDDHRPVVAIVAHGIHNHGGMERVTYELIRRLHTEFRFLVVAAKLEPSLIPSVERWIRIRVPRKPIPLKRATFYLLAGRALSKIEVDLIYTVGAIVPNRTDIAAVHFCHAAFADSNDAPAARRGPLLRRINGVLARRIALEEERRAFRPDRLRTFAAVSERVAAELELYYPDVASSIIPNGVDIDQYSPNKSVRQRIRGREGAEDGVIVAIFAGGDWDRKGLAIAIEAVGLARERGLSAQLWVVGRGDQRRFASLIDNLGAGVIRFFGERSDLDDLYKAADVFLLPSMYETFSLATLEAASSALPVIVTPHVGVGASLVGANKGGRMVERSSDAFASALVEIGANAKLRMRLGEAARQQAIQFSWNSSAEKVRSLFVWLLSPDSQV